MRHLPETNKKMASPDEYLLELALQGDTASFGEIAKRWQDKIFRFIWRYVGNREEAQDLTQSTFTKAFQNLDRLNDPSRFSSWVYTIALNECRMRGRRRQRQGTVVPFEEYARVSEPSSEEVDPESALFARESVALLKRAFEQLPEEQRSVIVMKEYQGLKFHEIAQILDVPLSTVKSRLYLGLKSLKRLMEN